LRKNKVIDIQGDYLEAVKILTDLYERIDETNEFEKDKVCLTLALIFSRHKDFEKSAIWFGKMPREILADKELAHKYINALYSAKKYGETLIALRDARGFGVSSAQLVDLEAWLAEHFGDRNLAISLQKQLTEIEPTNINYKIELARLEFLNNEQKKSLEILNNLETEDIDNPMQLMLIAEMFSFIGENQKAIQLAYRARREGQDTPEVHISYIALFTRIDDDLKDLLDINQVQPDSAILLTDQRGNTRWVKLLSTVKPSGDWEFSPNSSIGKLLLTKEVTDTIEFKSTSLESLSYTIQEIQSIYVRAFQESLNEFGTRFPEHSGLQKMEIPNGDVSKILVPLYQRSEFVDKVLSLYEQGKLPLSTVAKMLGVSQIEIFVTQQALKNKRVFASFGTTQDQEQQANAISTATSITLDITGLLTLSQLNLLPLLAKRFEHIYVHQRLIDELDALLLKKKFDLRKGTAFIGYQDGRPYFEEISPNAIEESIKFLTDLKNYIEANCTVISIEPEQIEQVSLTDEVIDNLGYLAIYTALIAVQTKTPLYADDAALRGLVKELIGTDGVWSQVLLRDTVDKEFLNEDEYTSACASLQMLNYYFVSVNKDLIMSILDKSSYTVGNEEVYAIISGLKGPHADEDKSINIAARVLKDLWLSDVSSNQKRFILDAILFDLCFERSVDIVIRKLHHQLQIQLMMAPKQLRELSDLIDLFYGVRKRLM
jgi:hypothetical protein